MLHQTVCQQTNITKWSIERVLIAINARVTNNIIIASNITPSHLIFYVYVCVCGGGGGDRKQDKYSVYCLGTLQSGIASGLAACLALFQHTWKRLGMFKSSQSCLVQIRYDQVSF